MYVEMFHLQKNMVFFTVITISIYINYNYVALFFYYPYLKCNEIGYFENLNYKYRYMYFL